VIEAFLDLFEATRIRLGISIEDMWNMDETGTALGVCNNSTVLASSTKKKTYQKSPETREWASTVECISATGRKLRPVVIFKGQNVVVGWFMGQSVEDWYYTTSQNGWTSNAIGLEWLKRVFIPETSPTRGVNQMLILDGHGSHDNIEFMWECYQHKIHLLYLLAHASHILQPLDLASFSVLKSSYRKQIRALSAISDSAPVKKNSFMRLYKKAREAGLSEKVIRAGWRATGLSPFNKDLVMKSTQLLTRPVTPPPQTQSIYSEESLFKTPQRSQDVYNAQRLLQRSESLSRSTRALLGKAGKAISIANTRAAELYTSNMRLQHQLDQFKIHKPKSRVPTDANERFRNVEVVRAAVDAAATKLANKAAKPPPKPAKKVVKPSKPVPFNSMLSQFQLE
jgi:hypothetical protein